MYYLLAVLIFGILIAVHELGHFTAAKACGIPVLEFSIGMGPTILKKQGKETLYSLRLFPIGGFCAMEGEDSESDDPRAFTNQPPIKRFIVLASGAGMNFLFGFVLILFLIWNVYGYSAPLVSGFMDGCPYEGESGFMSGDFIYKIDGERTYFTDNVSFLLVRSKTGVYDIVLKRGNEKIYLDNYKMERREYTVDGRTGKWYGLHFSTEPQYPHPLKAWYCAMDYVRLVRLSLVDLITGVFGIKDLSGPVGIVDIVNETGTNAPNAAAAAWSIANLTAFITINLAVMNLLPIPALDGARIFFLAVTWVLERLLRRKIDPKYEGYIHATGLVLLLALSVFVMYNDILRLIGNAH